MSKNGKFLHEVYTGAELELVNSSEKCKSTLTWINSKIVSKNQLLITFFVLLVSTGTLRHSVSITSSLNPMQTS